MPNEVYILRRAIRPKRHDDLRCHQLDDSPFALGNNFPIGEANEHIKGRGQIDTVPCLKSRSRTTVVARPTHSRCRAHRRPWKLAARWMNSGAIAPSNGVREVNRSASVAKSAASRFHRGCRVWTMRSVSEGRLTAAEIREVLSGNAYVPPRGEAASRDTRVAAAPTHASKAAGELLACGPIPDPTLTPQFAHVAITSCGCGEAGSNTRVVS